MSNWLFLMLLYAFFGWFKKKQRDKSVEKSEGNDSQKSNSIVDFGEGILNALIGDEKQAPEYSSISNQIKPEEYDQSSEDYFDNEEQLKEEQEDAKISTEQLQTKKNIWSSTIRVKKSRRHNGNILAGLIDLNDPVKTGVIFKEIFDKPKALR
ncbi:hypothetical protein N9W06_00565 [Candidatus Marinimicrobia bacterium]|nr:hypothetical protein [Candidatus Neomarinimicrobiota bacterium]